MNESKTMEVIQEAVLLAVHDIDLTFSEVCSSILASCIKNRIKLSESLSVKLILLFIH